MDLDDVSSRVPLDAPGVPSPEAVRFLRSFVLPFVRVMWRPTLEGLENLPASGPYLLVANHSGAMSIAELLSVASLWADAFDGARPLAGFAHPFSFVLPPIRRMMSHVGAVPSSYEAGRATLAAGVPLLVFPGGDHEAGRPLWHANTVDFGGRVGFLKLARQAGVPIVPMGIRGSHFTAPVLLQSRLLASLFVLPRAFGVKRYPLTALAVLGALAILRRLRAHGAVGWAAAAGWLASPLALVPWVPWTIRFRIGAPLAREELDALPLDAARRRVEAAVQALVARRGGP